MEWYYSRNSERLGPISEDAFRELIAFGQLPPGTLVWNKEMPDWVPLKSQPQLVALATSLPEDAPPPVPPSHGSAPYQPPGAHLGRPGAAYRLPSNCNLAITSMCLSIGGALIGGPFLAVPGVIVGHLSLRNIRAAEGGLGGRGMAIAGLVIGYIIIAITVLVIGFFFLVFMNMEKMPTTPLPAP